MTRTPAVILAALLSACGGDALAPEPATLATDTSSAQAGDARTGAAVLVLALPGPVLQLEQPALVRVHITGQLQQAAHYGAQAVMSIALSEPTATGPSAVHITLAPLAPVAVPIGHQVWLQLPAGAAPLVARITVRALDANGTPTSALARAVADVHWAVEVQP
jgi:hypothetical protein